MSIKRYFLATIFMLTSFLSIAHQPDISTSLLSTTEDGKHVLQVTSSLTAFEGEIDYIYSKDSYKTPEEFKGLVIKHFRENVLFIVNHTDTLIFANPIVILGHETKLVVEVLNVPKKINSLYYSNGMFSDMPQNKMAVMLFSEGFPKEQLLLDNNNAQTVRLELNNGLWENVATNKAPIKAGFSFKPVYILGVLLFIGTIIAVQFYLNKKGKKSYQLEE